ncbi:MAG: FtsX-like permease family protein [Nitrososphaerota archaeon]
MRIDDLFKLSIKSWGERKVRIILLMLAIAIGVASIIALVSQTTGVQQSVVNQLQTLGPTAIILTPSGRSQLTDSDVALIDSLPKVETVVPLITYRVYTSRAGQDVELTLVGIEPARLPDLLGDLKIIEGALYPGGLSPIGVVGYEAAYPSTLGGTQVVFVNQPLIIEQRAQSFTRRVTVLISGILDRYGASAFISIDNSIFMPIEALKIIANRNDYNLILVKADSVDNVDALVEELTTIYGDRARVMALQSLASTISSIIGQFGLLLGSIAGISLTVAGLGIMNIMMISVIERTKEIGVMKAVGYRDREVLLIFIVESFMIGILGGLLGIGLGTAASYIMPSLLGTLFRTPTGGAAPASTRGFSNPQFGGTQVSSMFSFTPVISPEIVFTAYGFAIMISVIAGIYPAWRASRLDPIRAIRYE